MTEHMTTTQAGRGSAGPGEARPAWVGDLRIDDPGELERLYALSGIDAAAWKICGLDVRLSYGRGLRAGLFAVKRDRLHEADGDWRTVARNHDQRIPVTEFRLEPSAAHHLLALFPDINLVAADRRAVPSDDVALKVVESVLPPSRTAHLEADPTWQPG